MTTYLFDAYGTLFDLNSAFVEISPGIGRNAGRVFEHWRGLQLQYAWLANVQGAKESFSSCTQRAVVDALSNFDCYSEAREIAFMQAFENVALYDDAKAALEQLDRRGAKLGVLSNGDGPSLQKLSEKNALNDLGVEMISVDVSSSFKPAPGAYEVGLKFSDTDRSATTFVSSNWWDVIGAKRFGFNVVWLNRYQTYWPKSVKMCANTIQYLGELAET
ncbi:haloacid dehalogenase type II [Epibacterium sp. SM1979]|uniref:(S)-2-haloacid dehalogenase n=1 Tax=Tritonibacter litoralis TaxID=2662264 RepID=A0A843YID7_9RHOB|nr:haloacid dehalogenase type II [Tritonibacter litoralis]MQQ10601.1 haloacid dehalogenase type II [Tritonibacter litoralis]